jgi:aspartyl/glutamyl-tRNA(Asn/Gln) amidotransferase C subunit
MEAASDRAIDRAMLRQICDLARLNVPAERQEELLGRLKRVVEAFGSLHDLPEPSDGAAAPSRPKGMPLRQDEAEPPLPIATVLANAPKQAAECFLVPRVVDA